MLKLLKIVKHFKETIILLYMGNKWENAKKWDQGNIYNMEGNIPIPWPHSFITRVYY